MEARAGRVEKPDRAWHAAGNRFRSVASLRGRLPAPPTDASLFGQKAAKGTLAWIRTLSAILRPRPVLWIGEPFFAALRADGQSHEHILDLSGRPRWAGRIVTMPLLAPTGAPGAGFRIAFLRGEE